MDDKELVIRIKNSLKAGKSSVEITEALVRKGYKLAYAEALIRKAKRKKIILITTSIILVVILSLTVAFFALFDNT